MRFNALASIEMNLKRRNGPLKYDVKATRSGTLRVHAENETHKISFGIKKYRQGDCNGIAIECSNPKGWKQHQDGLTIDEIEQFALEHLTEKELAIA